MKTYISVALRPYVLTVILMIIGSAIGQEKVVQDTLVAQQYFVTADSLSKDLQYENAIGAYQKALAIYQEASAWERVAECYNGMSKNYFKSNDFKASLETAKKAIGVCNHYLKNNHRQEAFAYDHIGDYYQDYKINHPRALKYYKKALAIRETIESQYPKDIAYSYMSIGELKTRIGHFEEARIFFEKALAIRLKEYGKDHYLVAIVYSYIAMNLSRSHQLEKSVKYYHMSISIAEKGEAKERLILLISNYSNIGGVYKNMGKYDEALRFQYKSLELRKQLNLQEIFQTDSTYIHIGVLHKNKGEYEKAIQYYLKALSTIEKNYGKNHFRSRAAYNNLGVVYKYKKIPEQALLFYEKAFLVNNNNIDGELLYYNNSAYIFILQQNYEKALDYINRSLQIQLKLSNKRQSDIADCYSYRGLVYKSKKAYPQALLNYNKARGILTQIFGEHHPLVANVYNNIAMVYAAQKEWSGALQYYNKAIRANTTKSQDTGTATSYADANYLLASLQGKASAYQQRHIAKKNRDDLQKSMEVYQQADTLIHRIRQTLTTYQDKVRFAETSKELYKDAITATMLLYTQDQDTKALEQVFYYAEKSKANTLKELLAVADAKNYKGLPQDLIALEKELRIDHAFYQSQLTQQQTKKIPDTTKINRYQNRLFTIARKQDSITEILEKNYPQYYTLKYQNKTVSVAAIQQKLDDTTTLVEFFTTDSSTYAFTISKNDMQVQALATPGVDEAIKNLHQSITTKDLSAYKPLARRLYKMLITPIADQLTGDQLIIVPDGPLWHLNFDLLLTEPDQSNNPVALSYFLREQSISYANSVNVWYTSLTNKAVTNQKQECLAFSFSDQRAMTEETKTIDTHTIPLATLRNTSADLPGTRKEIKAIADIIDGTYFYGKEAIEANFKKNASQYSMLHLAVHGEVDHERPENSRLYFTKSKDSIHNSTSNASNDSIAEDNFLYAHELFALDIPAALTVLSACNTGAGKIAKGEGIMSLGTAFQYAGTKSLLLTNWEVSDQTTPTLMRNFYSNLKAGMNKAKALQQAKLQYLQTADLHRTHPFYWGGFYLVGDRTPIQFADDSWYQGWAVGLLLLIGIVVFGVLWYIRIKRMGYHEGWYF